MLHRQGWKVDQGNLSPIFDLDIVQYRCGFAADSEAKYHYDEDYINRDYLEICLGNVKKVLDTIREKYRGPSVGFLTGPGNFRFDRATILPYKGNRDATHKPKYFKEIKQYLLDHQGATLTEGEEADDAIGIYQYAHTDKSTIIVSTDKDLNQIPGWHYNWVKDQEYYVTIDEANKYFYSQLLTGDATDNIRGVPGVGPVTAARILADCEPTLEGYAAACRKAYEEAYPHIWKEALEENADLLWIRRKPNQRCPLPLSELMSNDDGTESNPSPSGAETPPAE